jgi:hypothetical protein
VPEGQIQSWEYLFPRQEQEGGSLFLLYSVSEQIKQFSEIPWHWSQTNEQIPIQFPAISKNPQLQTQESDKFLLELAQVRQLVAEDVQVWQGNRQSMRFSQIKK